MAEARVDDVASELEKWPGDARKRDWLGQCARRARASGGYVKRIVWDEADGYPPHAWGYTQYTVRPYFQGYGCDGSTDANIHLIAAELCGRLGLDYADAYRRAYPGEEAAEGAAWIGRLVADERVRAETRVPEEITQDSIVLMLHDLYDINNRSLTAVLEEELMARGYEFAEEFCALADGARKRAHRALKGSVVTL